MPSAPRASLLLAFPLLTLAGFLAPWLPPLDAINQFTPILFIACMVVLVFGVRTCAGPWRSVVLAASIVGLYISGANLLAERVGRWMDVRGPCAGPTVSVLTQNLWSLNADPWRTAEALKRSGADVLLLQEVRGSGEEVVRLLRRDFPYAADCSTNRWCSLTILSRRPILGWRYHQGRWAGADPDVLTYVLADIDSGLGRPMTVVTTHLLHLSDHDLQSRQINQLVAALADQDRSSLILGGDLNLTPWTFTLKSLDSLMRIRRVSRDVPTWPARAPLRDFAFASPAAIWPIDHMYAGGDWRACKVASTRRTGSDHYGVMVRFMPAAASTPRHRTDAGGEPP